MEQNTDDKKIISKLFISKEDIAERLNSIVELSQGVIQIFQETGETQIEGSSNLNNSENIFLHLLGSFLSHRSGLKEKDSLQTGEIADKIKVPITTVPAPMNVLLKERVITRTEKGSYQLNFDNYKGIKEMLQKIRNKTVHKEE